LNTDGTVDTTFDPSANSSVFSIAVQTDGKILIGGSFTTLNGGTVTRNLIARLNTDGTVDTTFNPNADNTVVSIAVQTDGKILIGGDFSTLNGGTVTRNRIARLNADGTVDTTFDPNVNSAVFSIAVQTDGKILIGGAFSTLNGGTVTRNRIARLRFASPTAATVSVGGRVMTMNGRGIMNVRLTLTDSNGEVRTTRTTSFGYYRFNDVQAGETYVLSAAGKRYTFSQSLQVLNVSEETMEVNFIAN
jgi:uncharacterized delta-60 repeat protein